MADRRGVIFDVDGVLVDSYWAHLRSWETLAQENGRDYSESEFVRGFGRTSREILTESWSTQQPPDEEQIRRWDMRKEGLYRSLISEDFPAMDGAVELIRDLHENGFALAVGSSGPPENVQLVIDKLGIESLIDARVTGADVTRGKPDPQVFQMAAARLGIDPGRCLVIEDAKAGIAAAHAAGIKCIGLVSTGHSHEELKAADLLVDSLRELSAARLRKLI